MTRTFLAFCLALTAAPADAQTESERLDVIGWGRGCAVAVNHSGLTSRIRGLPEEPAFQRVGILSLVPGKGLRTNWTMEASSPTPDQLQAGAAEVKRLGKSGYAAPGQIEELPPIPTGLAAADAVLFSTATLGVSAPGGLPGAELRLERIHYSPLKTCALLVYVYKAFRQETRQFVLARLTRPGGRRERAQARLSLAKWLFDQGGLAPALAHAGLAAQLAPENAVIRYEHATYLALNGRLDEALDELAEAIQRSPQLRGQAAEDRDFESLAENPQFKKLLRLP